MNDLRPTPVVDAFAELDDVDHAILRRLARDGRLANNALAEAVGIAPSTCLARVRQLRESGVIRGFYADISPEALGRPLQAFVAIRLQQDARAKINTFATYLTSLPGVLNVYFLAGGNDFQVHVAARDTNDLRKFVVDHLSAKREVASTETNLVFEHIGPRAL